MDFHPYGNYVATGSVDTNIKVTVNIWIVTNLTALSSLVCTTASLHILFIHIYLLIRTKQKKHTHNKTLSIKAQLPARTEPLRLDPSTGGLCDMHEPKLTDPSGHPLQYNHRIRFQR